MVYPEENYLNRMLDAFTKAKGKLSHNLALVYVTHGNSMHALLPLIQMSMQEYIVYSIDFCATTMFRLSDSNKLELVGDLATSEHVGLGKGEVMRID